MSTRVLPSARTARDAVLAILETLEPEVTIFDGEVDESQLELDSDGRVHGYAVLWAGSGTALQQRLCMTPDARQFPFQVSAVGGDVTRCLWVADKVTNVLPGARLSIPDGTTTPLRQGEDQGPARIDRSVKPTRHFLPLFFSCRLA